MSHIDFLWYPRCSTSRKAKAWLDDHAISYNERDIVVENPTVTELEEWHTRSGLPIRRLFNTSGQLYREQKIKEKLDTGISDAEAYKLLASSGIMVKRPVLVGTDFVFFGFKQDQWEEKLLS